MGSKEKKSWAGGLLCSGTFMVTSTVIDIALYPSWWRNVWWLETAFLSIGSIFIVSGIILKRKVSNVQLSKLRNSEPVN
jgi:hypothetical protein